MNELLGEVVEVQAPCLGDQTPKIGEALKDMHKLSGSAQAKVDKTSVSKPEKDRHDNQLLLPGFTEPHRDVVLSIRPKFSSRIISGEKTVELRRRFPVSVPKGTIAYIYATSPERAMVAVAEISSVRKLAIEEIWCRYADVAYIERPEFERYFEGLEKGFALEFANVRPFETPVDLTNLRERFGFEPPQSFLYAKQDLRKALKDEQAVVSH